jgi:superfamily II DNA/RNA helicase
MVYVMSFTSLALNKNLLNSLAELGYEKPTPIQEKSIPFILDNEDVMARAQTGTGKTAAFALPLLEKLLSNSTNNTPRILVLVPTRELAQQVYKNFISYINNLNVGVAVIHGGVSGKEQLKLIKEGAEIIIATPGRLIDNLNSSQFTLKNIESVVLDEADRMLDLGFKEDINHLLSLVPSNRQTLLFSATFNDDVYKFSKKHLKTPKIIELDENNTAAGSIEQKIYTVDESRKRELTSYLIGSKNWKQVLIFTRTKSTADMLAKEMTKDGIKSEAIHSDKSQGARDRALQRFKDKSIRALIATDIAARGIDIIDLEYVINYELPYNGEDYIHRIGRTGRAGKTGTAVSLVSPSEEWLVEAAEKETNQPILKEWFPGFEPDLNAPVPSSKHKKPGKKSALKKALSNGQPARRTR